MLIWYEWIWRYNLESSNIILALTASYKYAIYITVPHDKVLAMTKHQSWWQHAYKRVYPNAVAIIAMQLQKSESYFFLLSNAHFCLWGSLRSQNHNRMLLFFDIGIFLSRHISITHDCCCWSSLKMLRQRGRGISKLGTLLFSCFFMQVITSTVSQNVSSGISLSLSLFKVGGSIGVWT